ncbi:MAG: hypothetical protein Q9166_005678 [cf. Caloplaca sp. 2 TL-2023]
MDVTRQTFYSSLPSLLETIADAEFVAIDFELSGIPPKGFKDSQASKNRQRGMPALQERYEENKVAAEKYHVMQMGITCVVENIHKGAYVVLPYNFNLKPGVDKGMRISRDSTYSNDAMDFLEEYGFDREAARKTGIHYLSRAEEARERQLNVQLQDKARFAHVQPKPNDTKSLELLKRLREEIRAWTDQKPPKPDFLNFAPIGHNQPPYPDKGLNSYQKLLVHQCIRKEYPDLVSTAQSGFIQIVAYDKEREDAKQQHRIRIFEERLTQQIGLRWLVEAVRGGDLSAINPDSFNQGGEVRQESANAKLIRLRKQLWGRSTVLVGHNLFMDLIYFYACFFGPLPDKVEDFQRVIHELFPRIIDTKYLATHDDPDLEDSELGQLDEQLSKQEAPKIELHLAHPKYAEEKGKISHEAGFDSYVTARLFLRLAVDLETSGKYIEELNEAFYTPPEMGTLVDYEGLAEQLQAIEETSSKSSSQPSSNRASGRTMFSHATKFDLLEDDGLPVDGDTIFARPLEAKKKLEPKAELKDEVDNETGKRLPAWDSDFWKVYGNKVRVYGTVEGVCKLGSWPQ